MAHRKWKEIKQQPDTAEPGIMLGCCLNSFHFQWAILSTSTVYLHRCSESPSYIQMISAPPPLIPNVTCLQTSRTFNFMLPTLQGDWKESNFYYSTTCIPCAELCKNIPAKFRTLKMFRRPPQNCTTAQYFTIFPGRNVFTLLCMWMANPYSCVCVCVCVCVYWISSSSIMYKREHWYSSSNSWNSYWMFKSSQSISSQH